LPNLAERQKAFKELADLLTEEDLKNISESSRELRENFILRNFEQTNKKKQKQPKGS
jgi:hypothetical protein